MFFLRVTSGGTGVRTTPFTSLQEQRPLLPDLSSSPHQTQTQHALSDKDSGTVTLDPTETEPRMM